MDDIAVVIPAFNEEKVIRKTLKSLNPIVASDDIYVISDASTDETGKIVRSFKVNYTRTRKNNGKIKNLGIALQKFKILDKYKFVLFLDADTYPEKGFFSLATRRFADDNVACVSGQVITDYRFNIFIAYRALSYFIWQNYYKRICSFFNAVPIASGTSSIYSTRALRKIEFDENIIIEDFDITYQVYRKRLGKIIFEPKAKVVTQDPGNLVDYYKQTVRWNLGFFQSVIKHKIPFGRQPVDIAVTLLALNEVIHAIFIILVSGLAIWLDFSLYPSVLGFYIESKQVIAYLIFDIWLVWGFMIFQTLFSGKFYMLIFGPFLWPIQFVNFAAIIHSLYLAVFKSIRGPWKSPKRIGSS